MGIFYVLLLYPNIENVSFTLKGKTSKKEVMFSLVIHPLLEGLKYVGLKGIGFPPFLLSLSPILDSTISLYFLPLLPHNSHATKRNPIVQWCFCVGSVYICVVTMEGQ